MYGAIIGDIAGSYYEMLEIDAKQNKKIRTYMEKILIMDKSNPLFSGKSFVTDESILVTSIADAILNNREYDEALKDYGSYEIRKGNDRYGRNRLSEDFIKWILDKTKGNSSNNDSAVRISAVGFLYDDLKDVKVEALKATLPTHNNPEALKAAEAVATSIFLLRNGLTKKQLEKYIKDNYYDLNFDIDELRLNYVYTNEASNSVPQAIFCFLCSNNFEDAIRKAISIGGDSDAIAAIAGSLAEAYYGVPEELVDKIQSYIRIYMFPIIDKFYQINKNKILIKNNNG